MEPGAGRMHTAVNPVTTSVGVASTQVLGPNPKRIGILVSCPTTNRITLSFDQPAVLDAGIQLYPTNPPVWIPIQNIGDIITQPLHAVSSAAGNALSLLEIIGMP